MSDEIQLLPDSIANQIAAGEVVQRPASVVKELLENAIDAGATLVQLSISNAGKTMIQVMDNGKGMSETDARMSFERHATSKIRKVDDLFNIHTYGFRGEAMASIGAVARVELKTKRAQDNIGTEILIEDSRVLKQQPVATKTGTCTTVRNLFFNVPARKNFLKSNRVETKHIQEELVRAALSRPDIAFKLFVESDLIFDLKADSLSKRVVQLFGKNYQNHLMELEETTDLVRIKGFVGTPDVAKKSRGEQYFMANGRFIKSPYFNHAITTAFEGLLESDRYPGYFVVLEVSPETIDVNIHPTKTEVKFEHEKAIYAILHAAVRKLLNDHHIAPALDFDQDKVNFENWISSGNERNAQPEVKTAGGGGYSHPPRSKTTSGDWKSLYENFGSPTHDDTSRMSEQGQLAEMQQHVAGQDFIKRPLQVQSKYLVAVTANGLLVVHQNRAHERILFEQFMEMTQNDDSRSQRKLFPEVLELNQHESDAIGEMQEELKKVGFDLAPFGKNAWVVNGVPEILADATVKSIIANLYSEMTSSASDSLSLNEVLARSLAKGAAVKTGKTLSPEECSSIIDQLFSCKEPYFGIDGKPTLHNMTIQELDGKF